MDVFWFSTARATLVQSKLVSAGQAGTRGWGGQNGGDSVHDKGMGRVEEGQSQRAQALGPGDG